MNQNNTNPKEMKPLAMDPAIIVVGNNTTRKKKILLLILIVILGLITGFVYLSNYGQIGEENGVTPTVRHTRVAPTLPTTVAVTPTGVAPTASFTGTKYVFSECEIEIIGNTLWRPSSRGTFDACGVLSTEGSDGFSSFTNYDGTLVAVVPFLSDSIFSIQNQRLRDYKEYLSKVETQQNRYNAARDFLYAQEETEFAGFPAVRATLYRPGLGIAEHIFYKGYQKEYIVIWGGQTSDGLAEEVEKLLESAKRLLVIPTE
jgi:hypothetical protein